MSTFLTKCRHCRAKSRCPDRSPRAACLEEPRHDEGLEKVPTIGVDEEILCGLNPEEPHGQACVHEVDIGALHEALAEVLVVGLEEVDDAACLQNRESGTGCIVRQAAVECQCAQIEELADTECAHLHEGLELTQILHVKDRSHIAL